ncbi:hypothetical protein FACS1894163_09440 [Spirochaetia bacterium]|nr:hypothetical protein FACS1894163_09440 [Spirochaetia bacterium]
MAEKIDNAVAGYYTRRQRMEENGCKYWLHDDEESECPFCHHVFPKMLYENGNVFSAWKRFNYCPQCGEPVAIDMDNKGVRNWEDEEVALEAVKANGYSLKHVPLKSRTEKLCIAAVEECTYAMKYVPREILNEKICRAAVHSEDAYSETGILHEIPEQFRTRDICLDALKYTHEKRAEFEHIPSSVLTYDFYLEAVKIGGIVMYDVPESFKTAELCLAAVKKNSRILDKVPLELRTADLCMAAMECDGWALGYVPEHLRTRELCIAAVRNWTLALGDVPEDLIDEEFCRIIVSENGAAFDYIPKRFQTEEFRLLALKQNGLALEFVVNQTREICLDKFHERFIPATLDSIEAKMKSDKKLAKFLTTPAESLPKEYLCLMQEFTDENETLLNVIKACILWRIKGIETFSWFSAVGNSYASFATYMVLRNKVVEVEIFSLNPYRPNPVLAIDFDILLGELVSTYPEVSWTAKKENPANAMYQAANLKYKGEEPKEDEEGFIHYCIGR